MATWSHTDPDFTAICDTAKLTLKDGVLRVPSLAASDSQQHTAESFGFKWNQREACETPSMRARTKAWLIERYGPLSFFGIDRPIILDAGCGSGLSAIEYFGGRMSDCRYIGVDISSAVDVARARFEENGCPGAFIQCSMTDVPLAKNSVDIVFAEGTMHHTDSTQGALNALNALLKPGGRFMFYVYKVKAPIREYADDLIRAKLRPMSQQAAWDAMMPLTKLGKALGDLNIDIEVPEAIDLLGIPAGKLPVQRLIYWYFLKAFHDPAATLDELNAINFDWYSPTNAHRHTPEEVKEWCKAAHLDIERFIVEEAGITVIAKKAVS
ncbi:MAG: class I SAM-dependent methyltransferase [Rhodobacteraceae bacterium]|nr:class I SAM-dependent methyltransferase [Paracoccaceae bacterium]